MRQIAKEHRDAARRHLAECRRALDAARPVVVDKYAPAEKFTPLMNHHDECIDVPVHGEHDMAKVFHLARTGTDPGRLPYKG